MATHTPTTSTTTPEADAPAPGRRTALSGAALGLALALSGAALGLALATLAGTRAAAEPDGDRLATPADYAAMTFEPIPNMADALGTRQEWGTNIMARYPTLYLGAATLAKTPDELAAMAEAQPDAVVHLMQCLWDLHEKLKAESQVMRTAFLRLMSGCCRAGLE